MHTRPSVLLLVTASPRSAALVKVHGSDAGVYAKGSRGVLWLPCFWKLPNVPHTALSQPGRNQPLKLPAPHSKRGCAISKWQPRRPGGQSAQASHAAASEDRSCAPARCHMAGFCLPTRLLCSSSKLLCSRKQCSSSLQAGGSASPSDSVPGSPPSQLVRSGPAPSSHSRQTPQTL